MSLLAILTLVAIGLIVAALAVYLLAILIQLRRILSTLRTVNVALHTIADRVQPLEPILGEINRDLAGVRDGLLGVLRRKEERV